MTYPLQYSPTSEWAGVQKWNRSGQRTCRPEHVVRGGVAGEAVGEVWGVVDVTGDGCGVVS